MARLRSQDYICTSEDCGVRYDTLVEIDVEAGVPYTMEGCPRGLPCPSCGAPSNPTMSAPHIMARALPDGSNRGVHWDRGKEIQKLTSQIRGRNPEMVKDLTKEVAKLESENAKTKPKQYVVKKENKI